MLRCRETNSPGKTSAYIYIRTIHTHAQPSIIITHPDRRNSNKSIINSNGSRVDKSLSSSHYCFLSLINSIQFNFHSMENFNGRGFINTNIPL